MKFKNRKEIDVSYNRDSSKKYMNRHDNNINLNENKVKHMLAVAKKCYSLAKDPELDLSEQDCRAAFFMGYIHDIGYAFTESTFTDNNHAVLGANIGAYSFAGHDTEIFYAIKNHGKPDLKDSLFLRILNIADLTTDYEGKDITIYEKISYIGKKYGENSVQYNNAFRLATQLNLI